VVPAWVSITMTTPLFWCDCEVAHWPVSVNIFWFFDASATKQMRIIIAMLAHPCRHYTAALLYRRPRLSRLEPADFIYFHSSSEAAYHVSGWYRITLFGTYGYSPFHNK